MEHAVDLEAKFFKVGHERGVTRGEVIGFENGKKHGKEDGHQLGFELGFAFGVAEACLSLLVDDESCKRASNHLIEEIGKIDLSKVPEESHVQRIRARYKVLESRAGLTLSSTGRSNDVSF